MTKPLPKNPVFLSLIAVFLLLPFAQVKITFFGLPLYLPEIALLVALGCHVASVENKTFSVKRFFFGDMLATVGILLFVLGATISFLAHPVSLTGLGMLKSWFFFPILAAWLTFFEASDPAKRQLFFVAWFVTLSVTALGNLFYVMFGGLTFDGRLAGMYTSPNFLAFFVAPAILIALYVATSLRGSDRNTLLKKMFLTIGSLMVLACLLYTHSYGASLALVVSVAVFLFGRLFLFGFQKKMIFLFALLLLGVLMLGFFEYGSTKWQTLSLWSSQSSLSSRLQIWRAGGKMLVDQPLLGIGLGRFQEVYLDYQRYFPPYLEWAVPQPHNLFLAILLNTGSLGFFGFVLLFGRLAFVSWKTFSSFSGSGQARLRALFSLSFFIFFLFVGIADTPYFKNDLVLTLFLFLGLGFPQSIKVQRKTPFHERA